MISNRLRCKPPAIPHRTPSRQPGLEWAANRRVEKAAVVRFCGAAVGLPVKNAPALGKGIAGKAQAEIFLYPSFRLADGQPAGVPLRLWRKVGSNFDPMLTSK